jgi:hypothetical protein
MYSGIQALLNSRLLSSSTDGQVMSRAYGGHTAKRIAGRMAVAVTGGLTIHIEIDIC